MLNCRSVLAPIAASLMVAIPPELILETTVMATYPGGRGILRKPLP